MPSLSTNQRSVILPFIDKDGNMNNCLIFEAGCYGDRKVLRNKEPHTFSLHIGIYQQQTFHVSIITAAAQGKRL